MARIFFEYVRRKSTSENLRICAETPKTFHWHMCRNSRKCSTMYVVLCAFTETRKGDSSKTQRTYKLEKVFHIPFWMIPSAETVLSNKRPTNRVCPVSNLEYRKPVVKIRLTYLAASLGLCSTERKQVSPHPLKDQALSLTSLSWTLPRFSKRFLIEH